MMTYESFRDKIKQTLLEAGGSLTWTEIRTKTNLPQKFPNNQWVHRMETDIGLERRRDVHGIILWRLRGPDATSQQAETAKHITKEPSPE